MTLWLCSFDTGSFLLTATTHAYWKLCLFTAHLINMRWLRNANHGARLGCFINDGVMIHGLCQPGIDPSWAAGLSPGESRQIDCLICRGFF